ncbi:hypothetical protein E3E22_02515 [Thermococcus sp. MV5]|uniref:hypothetical protein n=2 Tax=unclassified Thermococcus TaxID=2627626 RepID=UPI001439C35B|nr:hypothetical protein [Thermococcus sp. MV5]NJE25510.1 hypothetical protein [Thermococcus sp. MV5]
MEEKKPVSKYYILPVFGEVEIKLYDETKFIFEKFKKDMDRLKELPHLGIIHETYGIPIYTRYDHVITMMALIEEVKKHVSHPKLNTSLKLSRKEKDIKKVEYSSIEEFLKSWSVLYPIGHFYTTFTAEHAFLRHLSESSLFKEDFKKGITEKIKEHFGNTDEENDIAHSIKTKVDKIITSKDIMRIHKIFTILKILHSLDEIDKNTDEYKKLRELAAFMFLREDYLNRIKDVNQRTKLKKIIAYFKTIRMLAFTILDGSFAPSYVHFDPLRVVSDIEKFIISSEYQQLLNDIHKFYTSTLYQNSRNMYYHHLLVKELQKDIFSKFKDSKSFIEEFLSGELDKKIKKKINEIFQGSTVKQDNIQGTYDIITINIPSDNISKPITWELQNIPKLFRAFGNENTAVGGIMLNLPKKTYRIDLFIPNDTLIPIKPHELVEFLQGVFINSEKGADYQLLSPLGEYILNKIIGRKLVFSENTEGPLRYPLMFPKRNIDDVITKLKELPRPEDKGKKAEYNCSQSIMKFIKDKDNSKFFIYAPNVYVIEGNRVLQEIDFLLAGISQDKIELYLAEIKSNGKFELEQLTQELRLVFSPHPYYEVCIEQIKIEMDPSEECNPEMIRFFRETMTPQY